MRRLPYASVALLIPLAACTSADAPTEPMTNAEGAPVAATTVTYVPVALGGLPGQQVSGTAEDINDLG